MPAPANDQLLSTRQKRCRNCGALQPIERFYRNARSPDGRFNECGHCHSERREHNRRLRLLRDPLSALTTSNRLRTSLITAIEEAIKSRRTLPLAFETMQSLIAYAQQERADKAARLAMWDDFRALVHELPGTERLNLVKTIVSTLPPKMRPKITYPDSAPASSDAPPGTASA